MKITINIDTGNAAFWDYDEDSENPTFEYAEINRILRKITPHFEFRDSGKCVDINGNTVGHYEVTR